MHQTQAKSYIDSISKMNDAEIEKLATSGWSDAQHFVRGKTLVGGSVTGDIFENVTPGTISFAPPQPLPGNPPSGLSAELAGPWSFYEAFRRAHGLQQLPHPEPPEIALQFGATLVISIWLRNPLPTAQKITLSVVQPMGWTVQAGAETVIVGAQQVAAARVEIGLPAAPEGAAKKELQEVTVNAEADGKSIGVMKLRVELRKKALAE